MKSSLCMLLVLALGSSMVVGEARAQHPMHNGARAEGSAPRTPLRAPGNAIFGTVQEAIRALEADSTTDWSQVDMEALRQHLIDMHHVAMNVTVAAQEAIDGGVRLVVRPTSAAARAALQRVLAAHPAMLQQETGWQMTVAPQDDRFVLEVVDPQGQDADKIRGLGYIGLLAYGPHHQHHHWMMARGAAPHAP